jgi:transcriptional regulator GlxA family with amidase domain
MRALPPAITVRADADNGRLAALAAVLRGEAQAQAFGSRAVLDKLSDALFVIALRDYLRHQPPTTGLLAALTDRRLSAALAAIHEHPGTDWTVQALADKALLSRAAFAQRFNELLGEPPMRYLARWRMTIGLQRLREGRVSVAQVAGELGFETEAAFRRAFKRAHGFGPGFARRNPAESAAPASSAVHAKP